MILNTLAYSWGIYTEWYELVDGYLSLFTSRKLKWGKFTNQVYEHSKDTEGHRVSIIILKLLHLLKYRKYGMYIDQLEANQKYIQRYVKPNNKKQRRCYLFLRCLMAIPKSNFNRIAYKRNTTVFIKQLAASPPSSTKQLLEQELIPFEILNNYVKSILK